MPKAHNWVGNTGSRYFDFIFFSKTFSNKNTWVFCMFTVSWWQFLHEVDKNFCRSLLIVQYWNRKAEEERLFSQLYFFRGILCHNRPPSIHPWIAIIDVLSQILHAPLRNQYQNLIPEHLRFFHPQKLSDLILCFWVLLLLVYLALFHAFVRDHP